MNRRTVLLTVGDGDLSASLALLRAYHYEKKSQDGTVGPAAVVVDHLVATTLISSREEWMQVYPSSTPAILKELEEHYSACCTIMYGVDATQLHRNEELKQILKERKRASGTCSTATAATSMDLVILFQYPHLGYTTETTTTTTTATRNENDGHHAMTTTHSFSTPQSSSLTNDHAVRHSTLLAHYLDSAKQLLISLSSLENSTTADNATAVAPKNSLNGGGCGCIHVCLTSGAIASWNLMDIVQRLDLKSLLEAPHPASRPLLEPLFEKWQQTAINKVNNHHNNKDHSQQLASSTTTSATSSNTKNNMKRNTGGGSRKGHWLGKYGYRHQPTFPQYTEFQTNVSSSFHFFFQPTTTATAATTLSADASVSILNIDDHQRNDNDNNSNKEKDPQRQYQCPVCLQFFPGSLELQDHAAAPARPPPS